MTLNDALASFPQTLFLDIWLILEQVEVQREGRTWPCEQAGTSPGHGDRYVAS